jgi:hypothetical protein
VNGTVSPRDLPIEIVDGVRCTTRTGIATLAGWAPGNSVNVRAGRDPDFPAPLRRVRGRYWYRLDAVCAYVVVLERRARDRRPPPVTPGDPDDLLRPIEAARALHIGAGTFNTYVRHSIPYWTGQKTGRPLLPPPDRVYGSAPVRREWRRGTLAAHQALRPGPGAGGGRPRGGLRSMPSRSMPSARAS